MKRYKRSEWRKRPRKDVNGLRNARISFRVTDNEKKAMTERAEEDGKSLADYMVCKALERRVRVTKMNQP